MDRAGFPYSLVVASVPHFINTAERQHGRLLTGAPPDRSLRKQTAVCLQHMSDMYIIGFKRIKRFRMSLCSELEF